MHEVEVAPQSYEATQEAKVLETIGGYYEPREVPFEVIYTWHPGFVLLECGCGERLTLTCSMSTCSKCSADHILLVQEELAGQCFVEKRIHPWRYAGDREELGLPC